jgi:hypothetical protein
MVLELLLNLTWIALGATALILWGNKCRHGSAKHQAATPGSAKRIAAGFVALVCVAILLFPIISASDDSQAMARSDDAPNIAKRLSLDAIWTFVIAVPLGMFSTAPCAWRVVTSDRRSAYSCLQTVHITNRPPPRP